MKRLLANVAWTRLFIRGSHLYLRLAAELRFILIPLISRSRRPWVCETVSLRDCEPPRPWACETVSLRDREPARPWACETVSLRDRESARPWACETVSLRDREPARSWGSETVSLRDREAPRPWACEIVRLRDREPARPWACETVHTYLLSTSLQHSEKLVLTHTMGKKISAFIPTSSDSMEKLCFFCYCCHFKTYHFKL